MTAHPRLQMPALLFVPLMAFGILYINLLQAAPLLTMAATVWAASIVAGVSTVLTVGMTPTKRTVAWGVLNFIAYLFAITAMFAMAFPGQVFMNVSMIASVIDYTLMVMAVFAGLRYAFFRKKTASVLDEVEAIRQSRTRNPGP